MNIYCLMNCKNQKEGTCGFTELPNVFEYTEGHNNMTGCMYYSTMLLDGGIGQIR